MSCDARHFPALLSCPDCGSADVEETVLPRNGHLQSYTRIPRGKDQNPDEATIIARVVLDGGLNILAQYRSRENIEPRIHMRVEVAQESDVSPTSPLTVVPATETAPVSPPHSGT
ncbi:Zn-ribbon domain-containing OB-fold protein [Nocardia rhamnosiphila]